MTINCSKCGGEWTKTTDVRKTQNGRILRRRKKCCIDGCGHRFTTWEVDAALYEKLKMFDPKIFDLGKLTEALETVRDFGRAVLTAPPEDKMASKAEYQRSPMNGGSSLR